MLCLETSNCNNTQQQLFVFVVGERAMGRVMSAAQDEVVTVPSGTNSELSIWISILTAFLSGRPPAVVPPCQQSPVQGALSGGDHMLLSPSWKCAGKSRQLQPFKQSLVQWVWLLKAFAAERVMTSIVLCHTASADFPWAADVQKYCCSHLAMEVCSAPDKLSLAGLFAFSAKPSVTLEVSQEGSFLAVTKSGCCNAMYGIQFLNIIRNLEVLKRFLRAVCSCKWHHLNYHWDWDHDVQCRKCESCLRGEMKVNA